MKKHILFLISFITLSSFAVEIQCYDPAGLNFTIVTSKKTNVTYFVCDDGEKLIRYIPLYDELMKSEKENVFSYNENILFLNVNGQSGVARTIEGYDLCAGFSRLHSESCVFFVDKKERP